MKIVLGILLALFVVTMAAGWYMARFACLRKKVPDYWTHPEALPEFYKHIAPEDLPVVEEGRKFLLDNAGEPVFITSRDGLQLQGHYIPPVGEAKGIYLQVHGYRSHPLCDFIGAALPMHRDGYGLFLIDQRACGGSEGKYITFGLLERYDVLEWCRYLQNRFPDLPVILDGISMGASTVMLAAGEADLPENVGGVIADCGFTSPAAICKKVLKQWFSLPPFPIYYAAVLWIRWMCGVWFTLPSTSEKARHTVGDCSLALEKNTLPTLIAHGAADSFVPHQMSLDNYAHCDKSRCALLSVPEAEHGIAYLLDKDGYHKALDRLLEQVHANRQRSRHHA